MESVFDIILKENLRKMDAVNIDKMMTCARRHARARAVSGGGAWWVMGGWWVMGAWGWVMVMVMLAVVLGVIERRRQRALQPARWPPLRAPLRLPFTDAARRQAPTDFDTHSRALHAPASAIS
eukprot:3625990-Pleurochrysis_carterae.AAC.1